MPRVNIKGTVTLEVECDATLDEVPDEEYAANILKGGYYSTRTVGIGVEVDSVTVGKPEPTGERENKYTLPTGEGYLGVHQVTSFNNRISVGLSQDEVRAGGFGPGDRVSVYDEDDRLVLSSDPDKGGAIGAFHTTKESQGWRSKDGVLTIYRYLNKLGVANGDDVRVYEVDDGLALVASHNDPFVEEKPKVTDGGTSVSRRFPPRPTLDEWGELHHAVGFLRTINDNLDSPHLSPGDLDPAIERIERCLRTGSDCTSLADDGGLD